MDWIWSFVTFAVMLHVLAFILWANWTRIEASSAGDRVNQMVQAFRNRGGAAPDTKLL